MMSWPRSSVRYHHQLSSNCGRSVADAGTPVTGLVTSNSMYGEWANKSPTASTDHFRSRASIYRSSNSSSLPVGRQSIFAVNPVAQSTTSSTSSAPAAPSSSSNGGDSGRVPIIRMQQTQSAAAAGEQRALDGIPTWRHHGVSRGAESSAAPTAASTASGLPATRTLAKDAVSASSGTNHGDLVRDFARYRHLQQHSGGVPSLHPGAAVSTQQQLRYARPVGASVDANSHDRLLARRLSNDQNVALVHHGVSTSSGIRAVEVTSTSGSDPTSSRTAAHFATSKALPIRAEDRGAVVADIASHAGLPPTPFRSQTSDSANSTSGYVTTPRIVFGDSAWKNLIATRPQITRIWNGPEERQAGVSAQATCNGSGSAYNQYSSAPMNGDASAEAQVWAPTSVLNDGDLRLIKTRNRSPDDEPNESTVSRSVPDFAAAPKRSILKKSRSYMTMEELTQPNHYSTRGVSTGSGMVTSHDRSSNDFVRSPSLPLLYRQRTFGGPQSTPRLSADSGLRRREALGRAGTQSQAKRVTFRI